MKPETKRRLAIEWLTLLCSAAVGFGVVLWVEVPSEVERYWKDGTDPIWFHDLSSNEMANYQPGNSISFKEKGKPTLEELASTFLKAENTGNTEDAKAIATAIRQMYSPLPKPEGPKSFSKLSDTILIALYSQQKYPLGTFPSVDKITGTPFPTPAYAPPSGVTIKSVR